jgi:hypothetical protein
LAQSPATDSPEIQQILAIARAEPLPQGWFVWSLRRDRVRRAALGWLGTAIFGLVLLIPLALSTVPSNFERGAGLAVFTVILLAIVGLVGFGGLSLMVADLMRLARADQYLLVMTPSDYLKLEPGRVTHVPMASVAYVTLKGVKLTPAPSTQTATSSLPAGGLGSIGQFVGVGTSRASRDRRRPPSLAFLDLRTRREVMVSTDDSFEELPVLQEILDLYARGQGKATG